jgi:DNA processing protein
VGNTTARRLLSAFGWPSVVFDSSEAALRQVVSETQARALLAWPPDWARQWAQTADWLQAGPTRSLLTLADADYPRLLLETPDPPLLLYLSGRRSLLKAPLPLAVVGSRNPTPQGAALARDFARSLAQSGVCVVSGLALGVDGAAHQGALDAGGDSVAVVGTGLDRVYPGAHRDLAHRLAQHGLLVSEFALGTSPSPSNFPKRNRIIAGLSKGTLVVEAALASGSLITARQAAEMGREVFAIPGSIHAPQSRGCHALIRQGAKLVESAQDVLEELDASTPGVPVQPLTATAECPLADGEEAGSGVLQAMGYDPVGLDALQARTGLDTARLQASLLELELEGLVARMPGGLFQRQARA